MCICISPTPKFFTFSLDKLPHIVYCGCVKVAVTVSLDHTYVTALKAECRAHNLHFSEYVMTALQTFVSPAKLAELRAEVINKSAVAVEVPK